MKLAVLMENTACEPRFRCAHGLSLYFETPRHRILFDAGPDGGFAENAEALGVDLSKVDIAVLSHGHSDHSNGLLKFFQINDHAPVYVHAGAEKGYYAHTPADTHYIGLDPALASWRERFTVVEGVCRIDEELTIFDGVPGGFPAMDTSDRLKLKNDNGDLVPDAFAHEQNLLITAEGKTVLAAGCAHRGIVNILRRGEAVSGGAVDVTVGGFHLHQLDPADAEAEKLLDAIGRALLPGNTVYYTGHCTGEYAFRTLRGILGERLRSVSAGSVIEL